VNPEEIVAVTWNRGRAEECPKILLRNGHWINASRFQRETSIEPAGDVVERLLQHISHKVRAAARQAGLLGGYSGVDPATTSEG
jgi:hypothetical protein